MNKNWPKLTPAQRRDIRHLRAIGNSPRIIADKFKIPVTQVYYLTRHHRPQALVRARTKISPKAHPLAKEIARLTVDGPSFAELTGKAGHAHDTIHRWLTAQVSPRINQLEDIFEALGYTLQWTLTPKRPKASNTRRAARSSSNLSQANGQSTTQPGN